TRLLILVSAFRHRAFQRAQTAPSSITPRLRLATGWDRLNSVQRQMSHWRVAALGSASLVALLGLTFAVSVVRATVATARPDGPLAVLSQMEVTAPSDAEIAYVLAGFVTNVRSLSVDPVIVRANWIDALDHVTARGARMLNAYALDESPFTKIGRRTVTVAVTKVVRAAEDAFEIHWEERILETGAPVRWEHFTGAVSILFSSPSTARLTSNSQPGAESAGFRRWRTAMGAPNPSRPSRPHWLGPSSAIGCVNQDGSGRLLSGGCLHGEFRGITGRGAEERKTPPITRSRRC